MSIGSMIPTQFVAGVSPSDPAFQVPSRVDLPVYKREVGGDYSVLIFGPLDSWIMCEKKRNDG